MGDGSRISEIQRYTLENPFFVVVKIDSCTNQIPLPNLTLEILANRKRPSSTIVNDGLYGIVLFCSVVPQKHI